MPDCVVGHDFRFEAVPTDVERGPDGMLYVTLAARRSRGPEPRCPRGRCYRVDPPTGTIERSSPRACSAATGLDVAAER